MKKHLRHLGKILYNIVLLIGCIIVTACCLYIASIEMSAKFKLYHYINTHL